MPNNILADYDSTTADNNTDIGGISIAEGMLPSAVNNSIRELTKQLGAMADGTDALTALSVDNLKLDGNTLSSTDTNGDINLTPNGTGDVNVTGTVAATAYTGDGSALTGISSVGGATGVSFNDSVKAQFGTGNDLEIYHSGTHSFIDDAGIGNLYIRSSDMRLQKYTGENMIVATADAAVTLYYDNSAKLATTSTGVSVTGTVAATSYTGDGSALTGIAVAGAAKGFGRLDATGTLTLQAQSLNISSVSDNSTGNHSINVTNSYSDAEYTIPSSIGQLTNAGTHTHIGVHTYYQTASLYKLQVFHGSGAGDSEAVDSSTFGSLA